MTTLKKVALNDVHEKAGAKMVPFAGYNMPVRYSSDIEEHNTVREAVGIFDVSHMGEFMIEGPKALDLIQKVSSNDASKLVDGKAQYAYLPNDKGGIVDDFLVYRMEQDKYMLVVNASNIDKDWDWISSQNDMGASMKNISNEMSLFAVQGPKATEALQSLTDIDLAGIKFYTFETGKFAGVDNVIISGTGYTGSGGFELYLPNEHAETVWSKIMEAGQPAGIKPIGLGARDTLRLEMGFCLYGNDIDETTSPIEAGLGWVTKFTKDFINKDEIQRQKENGVPQKLTGFVMQEKGIPRAGYLLYNEQDIEIGKVTSGSQSPCLSKGVGLGYIQNEYAQAGTAVYVGVRNRRIKAEVQKPPFYKG